MANGYTEELTKAEKGTVKIDKRMHNVIFAEVGGGSTDEVAAVASVFLNRVLKEGYDKALKGSSAYNNKSKQYKKADSGKMNSFEKAVYYRNAAIVDALVTNPETIQPYTHFENVRAFGEPKWAKGQPYKDVGRQRFYNIQE